MAKLDLEWLAVFEQIYATGSVSHAAERLGLSQAAASTLLNKLRHHFGDRLFARTAQGMQPTPLAQRIRPHLREAVSQLELARSPRPFVPAEAERSFRICMTDISEVVLLPALLDHLRRAAPGVQIESEPVSTASGRRLADGEVDLAVGFMPQLEAGFYQQTLFMQDFVCLAARDHPRVGERLTRKRYEREGHVLITTSGTGHAIIDRTLTRLGIERRVAVRVSSFLSVARIVAQTDLLVVVPRILGEILAAQEPVRIYPPPFALPSYAVKQLWHERFHADAGNAWLRQTLARLFTTAPRTPT